MARTPLTGVYAALPTPFDDQRRIDSKALDHLVDYVLDRTLDGLALLTEAAEDPLLQPDERRALVKAVGPRVKGKKAFLVSVSAAATQEAIELARLAEAKGAEGLLVAPPRVPGIGYRELYRHLDRLLRNVGIPVLLLVRPHNAVDSLQPEELSTLVDHPGLRGIFAPHAPPSGLEEWSKRREGLVILGGTSLSPSKHTRVAGAVCGTAMIAADQAAALRDAYRRGAKAEVAELETRLLPAAELLGPPITAEGKEGVHRLASRIAARPLEERSVAPTYPFALLKEALRLQGHPIRSDVRPPYEAVKPEHSAKLKAALQAAGLL